MFLTLIFSLKRRSAIPLELFYDYWVNAHAAQIASRLPGIHDLWLHQIDYQAGQLWPRIASIDHYLDEADRFEGVPEPAFKDEQGLNDFLSAMKPLMIDEENIFDETVAYPSFGQHSKTYVDRLRPNDNHALRFMLFIRQRDNLSLQPFRDYVSKDFVRQLAEVDAVHKLRVHLFEPYDENSDMANASKVSRLAPPQRQYQAMLEIAFSDSEAFNEYMNSEHWQQMLDDQAAHFAACHAFKITRTHRLRKHGELTLAGLRTPLVADIIERVGARSQLDPEIARLQSVYR